MSGVGIVSDTHDNLDKVRPLVALFNRLKPDIVLHAGDIVAQFVLVEFSRLEMKLRAVLGNCDGDRRALERRCREFGFSLAAGLDRFEFGGRRFVMSHLPGGPPRDCDYYVHGHTHRPKHEPGRPTVINPGEACGWLTGRATAALLDTDTGAVEFYDL